MNIYNSGYLEVSPTDKLYFECKGNPLKFPIVYLHGGPGSNFDEGDEVYFEKGDYNVIFYDQRRSGKSLFSPLLGKEEQGVVGGSEVNVLEVLEGLDMDAMVEDLLHIINTLGKGKVHIIGGSWGSTLALTFAITYPEKVENLVVRGIWLSGESFDTEYLYGNGSHFLYPDAWETFLSFIPLEFQKTHSHIFEYIWKEVQMKNYVPLLALQHFEGKLCKFDWTIRNYPLGNPEQLSEIVGALIEFWFVKNACFLKENFILQQAHVLQEKKVSLVHGRYDTVCPFVNAWNLHKALPTSVLRTVLGGHSGSEVNMLQAIQEEVERCFGEEDLTK